MCHCLTCCNDTQGNEDTHLLVQGLVKIHTSVRRCFVRRCLRQEFVQIVITFAFLLWSDLREPRNPEKSSGIRRRQHTNVCTVLECVLTDCERLAAADSVFGMSLEYPALRTAARTRLRRSLSPTPSTCNLASSSWARRAGVLYSLNLSCVEEVLRSSQRRDKHFTSYGHCLWNGDIIARQELEEVRQGELFVHTGGTGASSVSRNNYDSSGQYIVDHDSQKKYYCTMHPCIGIVTVLLSTSSYFSYSCYRQVVSTMMLVTR